jgi:LmbE family N-acetylglucosaminyl deacetylase
MARLAAEGHRVVLVVATAGEQGLADTTILGGADLGQVRLAELQRAVEILGCDKVICLGYEDSGLAAPATGTRPQAFSRIAPEVAASRLAALLEQEEADLLTVYDPAGGYGHPDHLQVHRVGYLAARLAQTPVVLEATIDRNLLLWGIRLATRVHRFPPEFDASRFETAFAARSEITHRVNIRRFAALKRDSMAAHVSQTTGGESERTLAALLRLPRPLFRYILGTEWYVRRDLAPGLRLGHPLDHWPTRARRHGATSRVGVADE